MPPSADQDLTRASFGCEPGGNVDIVTQRVKSAVLSSPPTTPTNAVPVWTPIPTGSRVPLIAVAGESQQVLRGL